MVVWSGLPTVSDDHSLTPLIDSLIPESLNVECTFNLNDPNDVDLASKSEEQLLNAIDPVKSSDLIESNGSQVVTTMSLKKRVGWKRKKRINSNNKAGYLNIGTWNVQGISNKWSSMIDVLVTQNIDIVGVCEHWLLKKDKIRSGAYSWIGRYNNNTDKAAKRGSAGIGFLVKKGLMNMISECKPIKNSIHDDRILWIKLKLTLVKVNIFILLWFTWMLKEVV